MIEAAVKKNFYFSFIAWHFTSAVVGIAKVWKNFLSFGLHYFPIKNLLKTLFSHWRRSKESYGKGLDISRWFHAFLGNMISRILGAIARLAIIFVGLVFELFIFIIGLLVIIVWIFLPFLVIIGMLAGVGLLLGL